MALYKLCLMHLIDITAKSFRLTMYFVCRFSHYVLRNHMLFVCSNVEQCSFVRTASRLCRYTIVYVTVPPCGPCGLYRTSVPVQGCTLPFYCTYSV